MCDGRIHDHTVQTIGGATRGSGEQARKSTGGAIGLNQVSSMGGEILCFIFVSDLIHLFGLKNLLFM